MNQLDFSPISQKDQESLDTFSFLHNPSHPQRTKINSRASEGCVKMFDKLCRIGHNRQSYGFQLLKQFILFSSDEETIEIHYKYTQYELDQGTQYLNNVYGIRLKLTLGKAFEDIRNFSKKKKVYENPVYVQKLVSVYDKILNLNKQQSYRCVIKILASFIERQVISKNGLLKQNHSKPTVDLIQTLEKQIDKGEQWQQQIKPTTGKRRLRNDTRQQDLLRTAKFRAEKDLQTSNWKQSVENVDSYEEEAANENPRIILKSMSNQAYDYPYRMQFLDASTKKVGDKIRQNKCNTISITPAKNETEQDIFQTKRKKSSASISKLSEEAKIIQNVIIIRDHKTHKREPDRYIRVPVVSDQIKIVEMIPESARKRNPQIQGLVKRLQSIGSRQDGSQRKSEKVRTQNKQQSSMERSRRNNVYQDCDTHECLGCKYCEVVREMQSYRMQRTNKLKKFYPM